MSFQDDVFHWLQEEIFKNVLKKLKKIKGDLKITVYVCNMHYCSKY